MVAPEIHKKMGYKPNQKPKGAVHSRRQKSEVCKQIALNEMKRKGRLEAHREVGQRVDLFYFLWEGVGMGYGLVATEKQFA